MINTYPASDIHKRVLHTPPKQAHCMGGKELKNLQNHSDVIVFLWLTGKQRFWYHIKYARGNMLFGYMLFNGQWRYQPVAIRKIYKYY